MIPRKPPRKRDRQQPDWPWELPKFEDADVFAMQALGRREANPGQQERVLAYILHHLCEVDRMTFWPGGEEGRRATDFAEGKRWVALMIRRFMKMRPDHRFRENP